MTDVMMMLGGLEGFMFSTDTAAYQNLRRSTSYRWQGQQRLQRLPSQQFLGPGEDTQELSGILLPHYKGGLGQIDRMRTMAGRGKPLELVAAWHSRGEVLGSWCIRAIQERQAEFAGNGIPLKIDFTLSLIAYGDDDALAL